MRQKVCAMRNNYALCIMNCALIRWQYVCFEEVKAIVLQCNSYAFTVREDCDKSENGVILL